MPASLSQLLTEANEDGYRLAGLLNVARAYEGVGRSRDAALRVMEARAVMARLSGHFAQIERVARASASNAPEAA